MRHRDIGARRIEGIGAWLLETEEFNRWCSGKRMDLVIRPYFATAIQEQERAISGMSACIVSGNQGILLLIGRDDSSLVIDKLCDEAVEGDPTVVFLLRLCCSE